MVGAGPSNDYIYNVHNYGFAIVEIVCALSYSQRPHHSLYFCILC